jgi:hypothetical protein
LVDLKLLDSRLMKFATTQYADPEVAARKLIEIANSVEAVQDGRIHIELINGPMFFEHKATPAEYTAGLNLAIERGWLALDRSGTYVKFTHKPVRNCLRERHNAPKPNNAWWRWPRYRALKIPRLKCVFTRETKVQIK